MLFSFHEFSYEIYHKKADQLEKVITYGNFGTFSQVPTTFSKSVIDLPEKFPEIENSDISRGKSIIANKANEPIQEKDITFAEANYQTLFSFNFIYGECYGNYDHSIALSKTMAKKYFGTDNHIGQKLKVEINGKILMLMVRGVYAGMPTNTIIKTNALISWVIAKDIFDHTADYNSTSLDVFCLVN